jgi:hypothetical protein
MHYFEEIFIVSPIGFDIFAYPHEGSLKRDLFSALVHAINFCCLESVGFELSDFTAGQYRYHIVRIPDFQYYIIAKTLVAENITLVRDLLKKILVDFQAQYQQALTNFDSNILQFRDYEQRLAQILH